MDILIQKEMISEELGISLATVNNWIKTQVIPSPDVQKYYSKSTFDYIINMVKNDQIRLNSRANRTLLEKKTISYLGITDKDRRKVLAALVDDFEKSNLSIDDGVLAVSFAILRSNNLISANWQQNSDSNLDVMLSEWAKKSSNPNKLKKFFLQYDIQNFDDDILGAFYQSIQKTSQKSSFGSYYTPSELLREIKIPSNKTILDPCCGSGGILLNILSKAHDPSKIFARDIDETALKICFINLVLFFNNCNITPKIIKFDLTLDNKNDLFSRSADEQFDFIVANPPWGSKFTVQQKEYLAKLYPELATSEIFSIALYNSLKMLKKNGELYFFLPYSFLNVAAHRQIRYYLFNEKNKLSIKLLGRAFKGVLSENILLHLKRGFAEMNISVQNVDGNAYQIPLQNIIPPDFIVSATGKTRDIFIIDKIYNTKHTTLAEGTTFALGIVTGNNKKYLTEEKKMPSEAVFRGKDIEKYTFLEPKYYLEFQPCLYQQTAPEEFFRQKKIVYRFIGDRLVCALDKENRLLLNSANLFVSKYYPMETIVSFFNSDIYTYIYRKKFNSAKVLKSHLQNLPLPVLSTEKHLLIRNLYDETFSKNHQSIPTFQEKIDKIICNAFSIDKEQYNYIKEEI